METLDYYADIAEKAFLDTLAYFKPEKKSFVSLFMFIMGLALWWRFRGLLAAMDKSMEALLFVLVPGGFAFFGLFAWNLLLAPARLRASERKAFNDQIGELNRKITGLTNELTKIKDSYRPPELVFEPKIIEDFLVTPQQSRVGKELVAELRITNTSRFEKGAERTWDVGERLQFQQGEQRWCTTARCPHGQPPARAEDYHATVSQRRPYWYQRPLAREVRLSVRTAWISASSSASVRGGSAAKRSAASNSWVTRRRRTSSRSSVSNACGVSRPFASASRANEPGSFSFSSTSTEFSSVVIGTSQHAHQIS